MKIVEGVTQDAGSVVIDNTTFINCHFKNCDLVFEGGDFAWSNTSFQNCRLTLVGPAGRTANFLMGFGWKRSDDGDLLQQQKDTARPN